MWGLSENKKKIILWTIVIILAIIMGSFWIKGALKSFSKIGESVADINLPEINMPDMPNIDFQGIEDAIKNTSPGDQPLINTPE